MIEPELAVKFIEQLTQYTEYNINIMDESGIIIASRDPKRVGTYHEAAALVVSGGSDMLAVEDDTTYPGVLPHARIPPLPSSKAGAAAHLSGLFEKPG